MLGQRGNAARGPARLPGVTRGSTGPALSAPLARNAHQSRHIMYPLYAAAISMPVLTIILTMCAYPLLSVGLDSSPTAGSIPRAGRVARVGPGRAEIELGFYPLLSVGLESSPTAGSIPRAGRVARAGPGRAEIESSPTGDGEPVGLDSKRRRSGKRLAQLNSDESKLSNGTGFDAAGREKLIP